MENDMLNDPKLARLNCAMVRACRRCVRAYELGNERGALRYAYALARVMRQLGQCPEYRALMEAWARAHGLGTWEGV